MNNIKKLLKLIMNIYLKIFKYMEKHKFHIIILSI